MGTIFNVQRYCTKDGNGIRTCVFLQGCPLCCPWCHNPEGLDAVGSQSRQISAQELCNIVLQDKRYYDFSGGGVTFSGGEPLLQADFVAECATLLKDQGVSVAIETCGNVPTQSVKGVLGLVDCVLFDIKQLDATKLRQTTGADLSLVLQNLQLFDEANVPITLRVPLVDTFNVEEEFFAGLGNLACNTKNVTKIEILPFHDLGEDKRIRLGLPKSGFCQLTKEQISFAESCVKGIFPNVYVI